ncbi:MAG: tetraacyldisaccharide 4'-kinase [Armatimonadia bacterium]|nr:tetraacyldisaccharide 4'-kinase [Armatimonadia bacterium]
MTGERSGPAALSRAGLAALSVPYALVMRANLAIYERKLKARTTPALPVASVGNITLGGTGKTTTTRRLVRELLARGVRPGIVLRGHKRDADHPWQLASDGTKLLIDPEVAGDEAAMLASTAHGAPIAVGKRRERVIELLADTGAQVAVLDDGFQYFRMERAVDLVLVDATFDLANARVFPAGYLREPLDHLRRATHVLITHADIAPEGQVDRTREVLAEHAPHAPVMLSRHAPSGFYSLDAPEDQRPPGDLHGMKVLAMSAVGNPGSFERVLSSLGAEVAGAQVFPDHHAYHPSDWAEVREALNQVDADAIVVTEKDAVKLPSPPDDLPPVAALAVDLSIIEGEDRWDECVGRVEQAAR